MKAIIVLGLLGVILIAGCVSDTQPKNLSNITIQTEARFESNQSKVVVTITANESINNTTVAINIPELNSTVNWTGNIEKDSPVAIDVPVNTDRSGNFSVETIIEPESSVEVTTTGEIFIPPEIFYNRTRSYEACVLPGGCWYVTEPRKGENFTNYFRAQNLTDEYEYILMQFEDLGGDPSQEEIQILADDNISLFEYHGDHTYWAKAPRSVLETKSYDFVRWGAVVENTSLKIWPDLMEDIINQPNGDHAIILVNFEIPTEEQYQKIVDMNPSDIAERAKTIRIVANSAQIFDMSELGFVKEIEKWYPYVKE